MTSNTLSLIQSSINEIGLGDGNHQFVIYLENTPPLAEYNELTNLCAVTKGEIDYINQNCGNGWRKVFNVYAKVLFALNNKVFSYQEQADCWQDYRDKYLLQADSGTAMLFSAPKDIKSCQQPTAIRLITGRSYAKKLSLLSEDTLGYKLQFTWFDQEFAIDCAQRIIVCPYFDYRQLSNIKIAHLVKLIDQYLT